MLVEKEVVDVAATRSISSRGCASERRVLKRKVVEDSMSFVSCDFMISGRELYIRQVLRVAEAQIRRVFRVQCQELTFYKRKLEKKKKN